MVTDLAPFKRLVHLSSGLHYHDERDGVLREAIAERMSSIGVDGERAYLRRIEADPEEQQQLIDRLTINETYFFREPNQIEWLVGGPVASHLAAGGERRMRILSLGCSTGEEPYSIAIAIAERFGELALNRIEIAGADIDRPALQRAAEAIYSDHSFRAFDQSRIDRHFTTLADGRRQLADSLRRRVTIHHLNLLARQWPDHLNGQDLILFRNVSIYFDQPTREAIQRRIATALRAGGHLVMSSTETLSNRFGVLPLIEEGGLFLFRCDSEAEQAPAAAAAAVTKRSVTRAPATPPPPPSRPTSDHSPQRLYRQALTALESRQLEPALLLATRLSESAPGDQRYLRLLAVVHCCHESFAAAERAARAALAIDDLDPDLLFLFGRIRRWQGEGSEAIDAFRGVVFQRPDAWQAHYHLAELYRSSGRTELAIRSYRRVVQLLQQGAGGAVSPLDQPLAVPAAEVAFLAARHLEKLSGRGGG